ncbi:ribosome small subunit-dependent GTPase A [Winogradskyella sp. SYSU M77433]|uniref:ribosome small subunit-dependent GTPase A n=1 Tax=Winogradskyella sp. SYSU M77433 TaxID=3042722 RepID=UPI00248123A8|nr:ribosome small subunit-dependent GTPase A [Winogradskyella sp. SYSU M77433]MDH7912488.1 ribosome small subunit-dependent GTPase A [Winogradskyella sp. SYSU M77433]
MTLEHFGYNDNIEKLRIQHHLMDFEIGRIISEHKERYIVATENGDFEAEITGNLRYTANTREDFPAVGDWVAISEYDDNKVLIHSIIPRKTIIQRQAVGKQGERQIIATNIDFAFIVQAVDGDFNINRIERYLTICNTSHIQPIILLNKIDLISATMLDDLLLKVKERVAKVPIIAISNTSQKGIENVTTYIEKGKTYCLLGSSGVGKSSLLNNLSGKQQMKTNAVSTSTNKGRHITTHRALIALENGGVIIDNPGMREVGITDAVEGLEKTFEKIVALSQNCRFKNCTHTIEIDCAVMEAVESGKVDKLYYENYLKMKRENEHFELTVAEKRKKEKDFGKMYKQFKNFKKSNKY